MTYNEVIAVLETAKAGKRLQTQKANGDWGGIIDQSVTGICDLVAAGETVRVAPKPRELWVVFSQKGYLVHTPPFINRENAEAAYPGNVYVRFVEAL